MEFGKGMLKWVGQAVLKKEAVIAKSAAQ